MGRTVKVLHSLARTYTVLGVGYLGGRMWWRKVRNWAVGNLLWQGTVSWIHVLWLSFCGGGVSGLSAFLAAQASLSGVLVVMGITGGVIALITMAAWRKKTVPPPPEPEPRVISERAHVDVVMTPGGSRTTVYLPVLSRGRYGHPVGFSDVRVGSALSGLSSSGVHLRPEGVTVAQVSLSGTAEQGRAIIDAKFVDINGSLVAPGVAFGGFTIPRVTVFDGGTSA